MLRTHYRFQIQGPDAPKIFEKMNGGPIPDIKFFHVDWINIGSKKVQALRHGMSGAPGLEIWGPYEDKDYIQSHASCEAARDAGVEPACSAAAAPIRPTRSNPAGFPRRCRASTPATACCRTTATGWVPTATRPSGAIGGSFVSDNIEDYYVNPFELGYDFYIGWKKDDFIGKAALEADEGRRRTARR